MRANPDRSGAVILRSQLDGLKYLPWNSQSLLDVSGWGAAMRLLPKKSIILAGQPMGVRHA